MTPVDMGVCMTFFSTMYGTQSGHGTALGFLMTLITFLKHIAMKMNEAAIEQSLFIPGGLQGGGYEYEFRGHSRTWRYPQERTAEMERQGLIRQAKGGTGVPERKVYLSDSKGRPAAADIWDDVKALTGQHTKRKGYPTTQKPLALLDRIIRANNNEGDVVFDPFCGCATAAVAAERLQRQWIGKDISAQAAALVTTRLQGILNQVPLYKTGVIIHRTDQPLRTDMGKLPPYRTHLDLLFGQQDGICGGCGEYFRKRNLTVDHIVPRAHGGTDHLENLWLLFAACNSSKGTRSQEQFLKERMQKRAALFPWLVD